MESEIENTMRWLAYREAREAGAVDGSAYDHFIHPDTRVPLETVVQECPRLEGMLS